MQIYVHDRIETGTAVCVRRTPLGVLVCSHEPAVGGERLLADVLLAATGRVICEIRNDPGEPDFDAPVEATAGLLIGLLDGEDVLVASRDWFAIERAREAGLATAFISGPGVKLGGGLAYVTSAGHSALIAHADVIGPDAHAKARDAGVELIGWGGRPAHPVDAVIV